MVGLAAGLLLSAADAVITKAYAPILLFGAVGGALIGRLVGAFGRSPCVSHPEPDTTATPCLSMRGQPFSSPPGVVAEWLKAPVC
jgi:hypothetical protein